MCIYVCVCACVHVCVCVRVYVCMCMTLDIYGYIPVCVHVFIENILSS